MKSEILIQKGKTYVEDIYWEDRDTLVQKPITSMSIANGAPRLGCAGHGLVSGWRVFLARFRQPKQINAENNPPRDGDWHVVSVVDPDTFDLPLLVPVDDSGREWPAYTGGGFVQYYAPQDLTGYTARMDMVDREGGTVLLSSEAAHDPLNVIVLTVDPAKKKTVMEIPPTATAAITFRKALTDLEMVSPTGFVARLKLTSGPPEELDPVRVTGEATT
jgi:hypothetical protein